MVMDCMIQGHPSAEDIYGQHCRSEVPPRSCLLRSAAVLCYETLVVLCADLTTGWCDGSPQEAVLRLDHPSSSVYCHWIKFTRMDGDWAPASLRALSNPQGLVSCLAPFDFSALGASPSLTIVV